MGALYLKGKDPCLYVVTVIQCLSGKDQPQRCPGFGEALCLRTIHRYIVRSSNTYDLEDRSAMSGESF